MSCIAGVIPPRVRILLVDDQRGNLLALEAVLARPEYDLVFANSGPEALSLVLHNDYAVILLDVGMPEMDGFEVATIIKQRSSSRLTPIIFVTASLESIEWIFRAYSIGAVDFLQKPFDPHHVRAKVAVFVELFLQRQQIQRQAELLREQERREQQFAMDRMRDEHERRFRSLAEAIPHLVWTAAADGRIEYMSPRWVHETGLPQQDALGLGWLDAVDTEHAESTRKTWLDGVRLERAFHFECELRSADGAFRWYRAQALPEYDGNTVSRWLGTLTNIDAERRAADELRTAVRMRDDFLAVASHEFRTPLTALHLCIQNMQRAQAIASDPPLAGLDRALRQSDRLNTLVDRLLDVAQFAAGGLKLELEEVDLAEAAREAVDRLAGEAERARCRVTLVAEQPVRGVWDRVRLEQLLINLLSNALKYGASHPVDVRVAPARGGATIQVTDCGIGIAPDALDRIFRRFERAVSPSRYEGLGLGLYVVARIVEAHAGKLTVDSRLGRGSTFTVDLPGQLACL